MYVQVKFNTTCEHLSKISELEISELSKKTKKDVNADVSCSSTKLISAACKHIPCTDEAAKEARTKLFSMWYSFGPPSVFFTISPGDECSF